MKKKIIRINDISEIDTSKISVYDLNNRYVDPKGNLYGLKYDRLNKKVEVIKLERMLTSQMQQIQKKIREQREPDSNKYLDQNYAEPIVSQEEVFFEPESFIREVIENCETHRQRLSAIIMNLDMSDVFTRENKVESNALDDLERHIDIDCIQQLEKLENYQRELTSYPRSVTYYQATFDNEGKKIIDSLLASKKDKVMKFIYHYEMAANISRVYSTIQKHLLALQELLSNKNADDIPNLSKQHKQAFNDAKTSLNNTITEVETILKDVKRLRNYALNKSNY